MEKPTDTYLTISSPAQSLYKEKGSKFIGWAYPVNSENEIKDILVNLRKEYYDAGHHCYAFMLGANQNQYRANDDGEPNHSAGDPILGQIKSAGLTNIIVVVVRYFGGTKLGVSGLIQAYKTAAAEAISNAKIIEGIQTVNLQIIFEYAQMNAVMSLVKEYKLEIINQELNINCRLVVSVRKSIAETLLAKLTELGKVSVL